MRSSAARAWCATARSSTPARRPQSRAPRVPAAPLRPWTRRRRASTRPRRRPARRRRAVSDDPRERPHEQPRHPRAGGLRRLRRHLEGAQHAAHAADVRHQRDPRDRPGGRPVDHRPVRQRHLQRGDPRDRDRIRHDQHRRRLPRDRSHARDVQVQAEAPRRGRGQGQGREAMIALPLASSFLHNENFLDVLYIIAFSLFIQGLRGLSGPTTAVRGNRTAAVGMAIAVIATLLNPSEGNWGLIALGIALGVAVGVPAARQVKMTAMPQMVALFNGVGGGAVFLISWAEFRLTDGYTNTATYIAIFSLFAAIVGSVSFWGSGIAFGKLQEIIPGR